MTKRCEMGPVNRATGDSGHPFLVGTEGGRQAQEIVHTISVVIPVYLGEKTLAPLVAEIEPLTQTRRTPHGNLFRVNEVILVHDCGPDNSGIVMEQLAEQCSFVKLVWLARNFGQHAATLAGAASSTSAWVITMDEDGAHDPAEIGRFLDCALTTGAQLVYALPVNPASHGVVRNLLSAVTKRLVVRLLVGVHGVRRFHSYRLISGEIARSLAAYCGHNVYLDVALAWFVAGGAHCPTRLRAPWRSGSGYSYRRLVSHFSRLVLTSGIRPLRVISFLGVGSILLSAAISVWAIWLWLTGRIPVRGWTSITIMICFFSGCLLFSLGVIAEYLGMTLSMAMGKPPYLALSKPHHKGAWSSC